MLGFLLILALIILFFPLPYPDDTAKKDCPPHLWAYKGEEDSEYMVCNKCNVLPGDGSQYEEK